MNRPPRRDDLRRNLFGALWHGGFLALGTAFTQPNTVLAAFISQLTGSSIWVGGFTTILTVASVLPQPFVARWIEPRPFKMPFLLAAIYLRVVSWGALSWLIHLIGASQPQLLTWTLIGFLAVFYAGGGMGGVPYTDIIGKIIPPAKRGVFFGGRAALGGILSTLAALITKHVLPAVPYPDNYALLFAAAAGALSIASLGFWIIREPPRGDAPRQPIPWREYFGQLRRTSLRLRSLIVVRVLTGFSLMVLPFYVVYARRELGAPAGAVGLFLLFQVLGGVLANLAWARLVDRYGSRRMLAICAIVSATTPVLAIALAQGGWPALSPVFFLAGAVFSGRSVGFSSALLELAPPEERPTFTSVNELLSLPVAFLPLIAGIALHWIPYRTLFAIAAVFIALGALGTRWLPESRLPENAVSLRESSR